MNSIRIRNVLIVGAIFIAIGAYVGLNAKVFPVQATAEAKSIDALFNFMLAIAVVVFLIVEVGIIYSILRFRRKQGDDSDGVYLHGNTALEITWTAIPAVIVFVLAIYSYQVYADTRKPQDNAVQVGVIGQQFKWTFTYDQLMPPDTDPRVNDELRKKIAENMFDSTLVLPLNRAATMNITAKDVLHAFYIPEFRIKQDAMPERINQVYFTPIEKGDWWVLCAELCGTGHGNMSQINHVRVVEQQEFDKYIADMYARAKDIATDPTRPEVGKILISQKLACGGCHLLTDAGINGNVGPSLNGIATRAAGHAEKGEGILGGNDAAAYIRTSIVNPNLYVVSGYNAGIMPQTYGVDLSEDELKALVNYLLTQK